MVKYIAILSLALACNASAFMQLGTNTFSSAYVGTQAVQYVRLGTNLIWQRSTPPSTEYTKWMDASLYSNCVLLMPFETNAISAWRDYSSYGNHGLTNSNPTWVTNYGGSLFFGADNKYVELPNAFGTLTQGTISAWMQVSNGINHDCFGMGAGVGNNDCLFWAKEINNRFRYRQGDSLDIQLTFTIPATWTHVVMTVGTNGMRLYGNNICGYTNLTVTSFLSTLTATNTAIGRIKFDGTFYSRTRGYYNDILLFNRVLTAAEVNTLYTNRTGVHGL